MEMYSGVKRERKIGDNLHHELEKQGYPTSIDNKNLSNLALDIGIDTDSLEDRLLDLGYRKIGNSFVFKN